MSKSSDDFTIDFDLNKADYFRAQISPKDLLAKAVGLGSGHRKILDLTAGLGIDAVHLSRLGCQVTALERNPVVFGKLEQALKKTKRKELAELKFIFADAKEFLAQSKTPYDCIYFDPMYPEKKKTALPRKEMQIFRNLVGADEDFLEIFHRALQMPVKRVVVKRPLRAEILIPESPYFLKKPIQFFGKTVRYDVYMNKNPRAL